MLEQGGFAARYLKAAHAPGLYPRGLNDADGARLELEESHAVVVNVRVDAGDVADGGRDALHRTNHRPQAVNRVSAHVHKGPTPGQFRLREPLYVGRIEPPSVRSVVRVAVACVGHRAQRARGHVRDHALHFRGEGLEVSHVNDCPVLPDQGEGLCGLRCLRGEGLFTEDRLPGRNGGLEQRQMAGVLRADDKAVHVISGDHGVQVGRVFRAVVLRKPLAPVGDVIPQGHKLRVLPVGNLLQNSLGVRVCG